MLLPELLYLLQMAAHDTVIPPKPGHSQCWTLHNPDILKTYWCSDYRKKQNNRLWIFCPSRCVAAALIPYQKTVLIG